jgi:DNA-binding transcriptional MocR family regulator
MSWGYPDFVHFPADIMADIYDDLSNEDPSRYLQYDPGQGQKKLRNAIVSKKIGDFGATSMNDIIITPGATFAIFLVAYFFKIYDYVFAKKFNLC